MRVTAAIESGRTLIGRHVRVQDLEKSSRTARQVAQSWLWTHVRALTSAGGDDGLLAIAPHPRSIEREKQRHLQVFHSAFHVRRPGAQSAPPGAESVSISAAMTRASCSAF